MKRVKRMDDDEEEECVLVQAGRQAGRQAIGWMAGAVVAVEEGSLAERKSERCTALPFIPFPQSPSLTRFLVTSLDESEYPAILSFAIG